jgi:hypothetical protein
MYFCDRNLPQTFASNLPQTCLKQEPASNFCLKLASNLPQTCLKLASNRNLPQTFASNLPQTCLKQELASNFCLKLASNLPQTGTCLKLFPQTCLKLLPQTYLKLASNRNLPQTFVSRMQMRILVTTERSPAWLTVCSLNGAECYLNGTKCSLNGYDVAHMHE